MYIFCIIMIAIASILLILAVLVQSPKSGMAANFGAANQTMGVRQTTDFLEKFTWAMIAAIVFFSLLAATAAPKVEVANTGDNSIEAGLNAAKNELNAANSTIELDAAQFTGEAEAVVGEDSAITLNLDEAITAGEAEEVVETVIEEAPVAEIPEDVVVATTEEVAAE